MKRFIAFIFILLISTAAYSATYEASNNDAMPTVLYGKTSSGEIVPLQVGSDGSVFGGALTIDSDGNIGIGTDDPQSKLDVSGTMRISGTHQSIGFKNTSTTNDAFFIDGNDAVNGAVRFCSTNNTNNGCLDIDLETTLGVAEISSPSVISSIPIDSLVWDNDLKVKQLSVGGVTKGAGWLITDSLVSFYKLEDNDTNTTVVDDVGANNGTATANTTNFTTTGKINNGFNFVAASSRRVDLGSGAALKFIGDFTVYFWMNTSTASGNILGNRSSTGSNIGYRASVTSLGYVSFLIDEGTLASSVTNYTTVNDGSWHFVILERSGTNISIYIDGAPAKGVPTGPVTGDTGTSAGNTYLGNVPQTGTYYNGKLDNVGFVGRVLTDKEKIELYNAGTGTDLKASTTGTTSNMSVFSNSSTWASTHNLGSNSAVTDDVGIEGGLEVDGQFFVDSPVEQTIAAGNTIAADACGSNKWITSAGAVTTDTTNTFTAPSAILKDCVMRVINSGANAITLDNNSNFVSLGGADVVLGAGDSATVTCSGASGKWYQTAASNN